MTAAGVDHHSAPHASRRCPAGTVQELRELYGADAECICLRSAEHAEKYGMPDIAKDWRELAAEVARVGRDY